MIVRNLQDRRKPTVKLDKEPAIVVREPGPVGHLAPQNDQLMSERRILGSSRLLDLNGEARTARTKQISATIAPI